MKTWAVVSARSSGAGRDPEVVGRAVGVDRPLRGDQLLDHRVDRLVRPEGVAEPEVEREHPLGARAWSPLTRSRSPHFRAQKSTYSGRSSRRSTSFVPLLRVACRRGSRRPRRASGWCRSCRASPGGGTRRRCRGREGTSPSSRHLAAAFSSMTLRAGNSNGLSLAIGDGQPGHGGVALVADHDVGLALADGARQAASGSTFATRFVQGVELGLVGHVAHGPVAQRGQDDEPLLLAGLHQPAVGQDRRRR